MSLWETQGKGPFWTAPRERVPTLQQFGEDCVPVGWTHVAAGHRELLLVR